MGVWEKCVTIIIGLYYIIIYDYDVDYYNIIIYAYKKFYTNGICAFNCLNRKPDLSFCVRVMAREPFPL